MMSETMRAASSLSLVALGALVASACASGPGRTATTPTVADSRETVTLRQNRIEIAIPAGYESVNRVFKYGLHNILYNPLGHMRQDDLSRRGAPSRG
jgi:hypothetical protein